MSLRPLSRANWSDNHEVELIGVPEISPELIGVIISCRNHEAQM